MAKKNIEKLEELVEKTEKNKQLNQAITEKLEVIKKNQVITKRIGNVNQITIKRNA